MSALEVTQEIVQQVRSRAAALVAKDASAIAALLADDFVYTNSSGVVVNKRGYIEAYVLPPTVIWRRQSLAVEKVVVTDDVAVVIGTVHDDARFGDLELNAKFRTTQTYRRTNGQWLYLAGHTSAT